MAVGSVKISPDAMKGLAAKIKKMTQQRCYVGIPSSAAARGDGAEINNAQIGFINEFGEPSMNIPARPHLIPGVRKVDKQVTAILEKGGQKLLSDTNTDITASLEAAGLVAISSVKTLITSGLTPALAPGTIAGRKRGSEDRTGDLPLIDTSNYLNHLTYVVTDKDP